jgi:outer membrane scaffolding protein for murein synthesis (MipA/OmpV family)
VSVVPGFYLRYGRISISNAGGFVTRRNKDDIFRGLGLDMVRTDRVRVNLALRLDNGRRSRDSKALQGIDDVRRTLRGRASLTWQLDHGWKVSSGWNADLLGRGGGNVFDLGVSHDRRLSPRITWSVGASTNFADHRYLQSYYGVSASESVASGYPAYTPGAGFRDVALGTGWRMEINPRWVALWGGSVGRLLGPAAASPLTTSTRQWGLNGGIAWRF